MPKNEDKSKSPGKTIDGLSLALSISFKPNGQAQPHVLTASETNIALLFPLAHNTAQYSIPRR